MNLSPVQILRAHGVHMYVDPQTMRMRYRAPAGGLTLELAGLIAEFAMEYEERAAIREHDGRIDRAEAERLAAADMLGEYNSMQCIRLPARSGSWQGAASKTLHFDMPAVE